MATTDVNRVWDIVKKEFFNRMDFSLVVSDALNAAVPISVDGDQFVLGFSGKQFHNAGLLQTPERRNTIEKILEAGFKRPMRLVIIEGTTVGEWETFKAREARAREKAMEEFAAKQQAFQTKMSLDELAQELYRRHGTVAGRQFPHIKAQFLLECIPLVAEAEEAVRNSEEFNEDTFNRELARVLDKLGGMTDVPASVVALELAHYKEESSGGHKPTQSA